MRSRARVAHVAQVVRKWNPAEWGGTETYVASVTRALGGEGWSSEVHAPSLGTEALHSGLDPAVALRRFDALNPYLASPERRAALRSVGGNLVTLDEPLRLALDRRIALAHLHTAGRIGGAVRFAMRWTGRPYVLSVHGPVLSDPALVAEETARRAGAAIDCGAPAGALFGARRVYDDAAALFCFNDEERVALEGRYGARVERMDHGVALEDFEDVRGRDALARWPALEGRALWLVVGRLSRQKNQEFAVRLLAASGRKDVTLVLAGAETDQGYEQHVRAVARELGVSAQVELLGNVPRALTRALIAQCEWMLVPSTHEAFGLVVLEGWAARKPVLFARTVGLRDLGAALGDGAPCIEPGAIERWLSAMRAPIERRAQWASEGRALCEQRFSWSVVGSKLARAYERAIESVSNRRAAS